MHKCTPCRTLVNTESKLGVGGDPVSDPMLYRSLAGALQYLTFTRPDISYVVQQVYLYMHDLREPHYTVLKCILCYIRGTIDHGLQLHVSSMTQLTAYTDADWAERNGTLSLLVPKLNNRGVEMLCVQHHRTKHIEIDIHFVRDFLASGHVRVLHVPSRFHYANSFTKGRPRALLLEFRDSLKLHVSSMTQLTAYTDADWAGCPITRRSTLGYCVFLGDNLLSWFAKRHGTLPRSSTEAEYRGVANVVAAETAWLCNLLRELHAPLFTATLVYCDNVSAVYLSTNLVQHQRAKHIEIDIHFVRDFLASGHVRVLHVPSHFHYADSFTKGLLRALFLEFRDSLNIRRPSVSTAGEY
ncbi:ribonuclease H-like domain-containing protein [Tanacetum coccineum]